MLHAMASILLIRVSICASPFMLCSAHACSEPQDPREEAASMEWWLELGDVVSRHRWDDETFLFCTDSNARVGSVMSNSVGGAEPDEESKNGEFFHAFLARMGMALPATFRGGGATWQDRTGRWHRLDHVGVACDEVPAVSRVEVDQDGVLAVQEREDHRLVTVSMQWFFQRRAAPFSTHASGASFADRAKLRLSAVRDFIEQEWCNTPPMPPQWTPQTMERPLRSEGVRSLQRHVRNQVHLQGMTGSLISEETWSALRVHGRLRSIFFRDVRRREALLLQCVQARWRASKDSEAEVWQATCDRLCRADDAASRSIRLQIFALHETSREAACLVQRNRIAWTSEQTKHIAGQLVLGRTTPLWQLSSKLRTQRECVSLVQYQSTSFLSSE